jgi:hypothetical protein
MTISGTLRRDVNVLRAALYDGDLPVVQRIGHVMQGAGDAYGVEEIPQIGAALEWAARSGDFAAAYALTTQLEGYLSRLETA